MLRSAGFVEIEEHDVTPEYLATARRKLEETERFSAGMAEILGGQELEETQARRRLAIRAITEGLLRRSLYIARAPDDRVHRRPGQCGDADDAADDLALEALRVEVPLAGHDEFGACDAVVQSDPVGDQVVVRDVEAGSTVVVSPARPLDQGGSPPPLES